MLFSNYLWSKKYECIKCIISLFYVKSCSNKNSVKYLVKYYKYYNDRIFCTYIEQIITDEKTFKCCFCDKAPLLKDDLGNHFVAKLSTNGS